MKEELFIGSKIPCLTDQNLKDLTSGIWNFLMTVWWQNNFENYCLLHQPHWEGFSKLDTIKKLYLRFFDGGTHLRLYGKVCGLQA